MGNLFLDIETYSSPGTESAKNPFLPKSKVILIAYNYYEGDKPPVKTEIKHPVFLEEWKSGEKTILAQFLGILRNLQEKDNNLKVHGFNILNFDLPYLFGRMRVHKLADEMTLYNVLFGMFGTDMMQLSNMISNWTRKKEQLWGMDQTETNKFFGIQVHEGTGEDVSRLYDNKEYDKIIKHCEEDFTFEQMLNSFYLYAERLSEARD